MQAVLQNLIFGIQLGSLYAIIAIGYTMVYGVLKLINFAHGDVYMVGAFVGYFACTQWLPMKDLNTHPESAGINVLLALVGLFLAMALCGLLGMAIERFAYRPLRNGFTAADAHFWGFLIALPVALRFGPLLSPLGGGTFLLCGLAFGLGLRPVMAWLAKRIVLSSSRLNALITAIGVSLLLQNGGIQLFGANPRFIGDVLPERKIQFAGIQIGSGQLVILIVSLALMLILRHIVLYTWRGKAMRAISHDIEAAKLMGIDTDRIISFTFLLGGAMAGAAGAMVAALTHLKITPMFGLQPGLKAFVAAVLGGIGNIPGAVLGGLLMGEAETFVSSNGWGLLEQVTTFNISNYRDAVAFFILILILLLRPAGLLGKHAAEKV